MTSEEVEHYSSESKSKRVIFSSLAAILLLTLGANLAVARFFDYASEAQAFEIDTKASSTPMLLTVSASYGRRGLDLATLDNELFDGEPGSGRWYVDGTTPATWRYTIPPLLKAAKAEVVVLQLPPVTVNTPSSFKELALRRFLSAGDALDLLLIGETESSFNALVSQSSTVYQARRGLRQRLTAPLVQRLEPDQDRRLKGSPTSEQEWPDGWVIDPVEEKALRELLVELKSHGITAVIAEWPVSAEMPDTVHQAIEDSFRPFMQRLADEENAIFIPLPGNRLYTFEDAVHPSPRQGTRWCHWLAGELKSRPDVYQRLKREGTR